MNEQTLRSQGFSTLQELINALTEIAATYESRDMYVTSFNGTPFGSVSLVQTTLTDGSQVYDVRLKGEGA